MRALALPLLLAILFATGCSPKKEPRFPALTAGEISADTLWKRITVEADWDTYGHWPGLEGLLPGQSPHGKFHEIYVNAPLREALPIAAKVAPPGSIIVKENFDADRKPTNVTVMAKVPGYDPVYGDWFWAAYGPTGKVLDSGHVKACAECHEGMKANDYIIIHALDAPLPAAR